MSNIRAHARLALLHALTPLHPGTGQTAAVIDLPIAREKATGYPFVPASSLKGVLREEMIGMMQEEMPDEQAKAWINKAFGLPESSGAFCFGDQKLLCLPVRSFFGTFAYVTCPLVLQRWKRDLDAMQIPLPFLAAIPRPTQDMETCSVSRELMRNDKIYLEDLDLTVSQDTAANEMAAQIAKGLSECLYPVDEGGNNSERGLFQKRFVIVSDAIFGFLSETATEVVTRIALGEDGTTSGKGGNLWYEEAVPAEAVFCGPVLLDSRFAGEAAALFGAMPSEILIQIGGNASVGRGLCRFLLCKEAAVTGARGGGQ